MTPRRNSSRRASPSATSSPAGAPGRFVGERDVAGDAGELLVAALTNGDSSAHRLARSSPSRVPRSTNWAFHTSSVSLAASSSEPLDWRSNVCAGAAPCRTRDQGIDFSPQQILFPGTGLKAQPDVRMRDLETRQTWNQPVRQKTPRRTQHKLDPLRLGGNRCAPRLQGCKCLAYDLQQGLTRGAEPDPG